MQPEQPEYITPLPPGYRRRFKRDGLSLRPPAVHPERLVPGQPSLREIVDRRRIRCRAVAGDPGGRLLSANAWSVRQRGEDLDKGGLLRHLDRQMQTARQILCRNQAANLLIAVVYHQHMGLAFLAQ